MIGLTRPGSGLEPTIFGLLDLPEREASTLLIRPSQLVLSFRDMLWEMIGWRVEELRTLLIPNLLTFLFYFRLAVTSTGTVEGISEVKPV